MITDTIQRLTDRELLRRINHALTMIYKNDGFYSSERRAQEGKHTELFWVYLLKRLYREQDQRGGADALEARLNMEGSR